MQIQSINNYYGRSLQNTGKAGISAGKTAFCGSDSAEKDLFTLRNEYAKLQKQVASMYSGEWVQPEDPEGLMRKLEETKKALEAAEKKYAGVYPAYYGKPVYKDEEPKIMPVLVIPVYNNNTSANNAFVCDWNA